MSNKWMAFLPFIQLLLLLLSRFSRVQLRVTPWTAAHQAPPSMGFSRQEYWSGVPLPSLSIYSAANIKRNYVPLSTLFSCFGYKVKNDKILFWGDFHSWLWKINTRTAHGNAMLQVWMKRDKEKIHTLCNGRWSLTQRITRDIPEYHFCKELIQVLSIL